MVREGVPFVLVALVLAVLLLLLRMPTFSVVFASVLFLLAGYFTFFFRDPLRLITAAENEMVSPADGKVLQVIREKNQQKVAIFLSIFDVHVVRLPLAGQITASERHQGKFLPAYREKSSELNERLILQVQSAIPYTLRLIAGVAARSIRLWAKPGVELPTGQKIGIMMFGSRAEVILPAEVQLLIKEGDKVKGGITSLARIGK